MTQCYLKNLWVPKTIFNHKQLSMILQSISILQDDYMQFSIKICLASRGNNVSATTVAALSVLPEEGNLSGGQKALTLT